MWFIGLHMAVITCFDNRTRRQYVHTICKKTRRIKRVECMKKQEMARDCWWGCYKWTIKMLTTLYLCLHHGVMSFKQFVLVCYCPCTAVLSTTLWLTSLLTRTRTQLCTVWTVNWISGVILLSAVYWTIPLSDPSLLYPSYNIQKGSFHHRLNNRNHIWVLAANIPTLFFNEVATQL